MCLTYQQALAGKIGAVLVALAGRDTRETRGALMDLEHTLRGVDNKAEVNGLINRIKLGRSIENTDTLEADIINFCATVSTDYYERSSPMNGGYKSDWHQKGHGVPITKRFREIPVPNAQVAERKPSDVGGDDPVGFGSVFSGIDGAQEPSRGDVVTV